VHRLVDRPTFPAGLALGVAFPCILTLAAVPTYRCGAADLIGVMVMVGIGLPALALLVLGAWIDASACLYSGSLSLTNEVKRFKLPWVVTCTAVIGCVLAVFSVARRLPRSTLISPRPLSSSCTPSGRPTRSNG